MAMEKNSQGSIAIAHECSIYDRLLVEKKMSRLDEDQGQLKSLYQRMLENGPDRFLVRPSELPSIEYLYEDLPNFKEPLDDARRQLALCLNSGDSLEITPILLLGPPGIGKTYFAKMLAVILETNSAFVSMSSLTAGWILSGSASAWRGSKPGKVFEVLVDNIFANPVMIVDEIDKVATNTQYDPLGAMYSLLEEDTAKEFVDEFAEIPIDASHIIWVITANDEHSIPDPILNRMSVYEIQAPTEEQARKIALNLYTQIRLSHAWGKTFNETPSDDVLDVFSKTVPRDMKSMWMTAFGNANLAKRSKITTEDLPKPKTKKYLGF